MVLVKNLGLVHGFGKKFAISSSFQARKGVWGRCKKKTSL